MKHRGDITIVAFLLTALTCGAAAPEDHPMASDAFTFVRLQYTTQQRDDGWAVDFPDSDLNVSMRLAELTSIRVSQKPIVMQLTDDAIWNYPFLYVIEPKRLDETPQWIARLRTYCERGGFVMFDDSWGGGQLAHLEGYLKQAFPDGVFATLPPEHPIFHCVYDLSDRPQVVPPGFPPERARRQNPVDYRAVYDRAGRMMILICHNNDIGDAWEREGVDRDYFEQFGVKKAYPLAINILVYAMTH